MRCVARWDCKEGKALSFVFTAEIEIDQGLHDLAVAFTRRRVRHCVTHAPISEYLQNTFSDEPETHQCAGRTLNISDLHTAIGSQDAVNDLPLQRPVHVVKKDVNGRQAAAFQAPVSHGDRPVGRRVPTRM